MGLRYVKGLSAVQGGCIVEAKRHSPFAAVEDFAVRTGLNEGTMTRLAESGALSGLVRNRRSAIWAVRGVFRDKEPALSIEQREAQPRFAELDLFETISWDFQSSAHSSRGHPLTALRAALVARRLPDAKSVGSMGDGRRVRYAGIVICRQRPGTASGVLFMTLEDETGFVNVVTWSKVYEEHAVLIKTSSFLGVTGKLQVQDGVTHLIAERFWIPPVSLQPESSRSHDFR